MAGTEEFYRDERVLSRRVGDGFLLLGPEGDTPTHIAGSCARVWDLLDSGRTVGEIASVATEESGVPVEEMTAMVSSSLELLGDFVTQQAGSNGAGS